MRGLNIHVTHHGSVAEELYYLNEFVTSAVSPMANIPEFSTISCYKEIEKMLQGFSCKKLIFYSDESRNLFYKYIYEKYLDRKYFKRAWGDVCRSIGKLHECGNTAIEVKEKFAYLLYKKSVSMGLLERT